MDYIERNHKALLECIFLLRDRFDGFAFPTKQNKGFDLIAYRSHTDDRFFSIKVVCTETTRESGSYQANLLVSGGYKDQKEVKKNFDPSSCDYVFVWTPEEKYLIPSSEITQKKALVMSMFPQFIIKPN